LILDEPTAGLDPNQIREIRLLVRTLGGTRSVILSTHILSEVEAVCDRVQIMDHGKIVYSDTISALKAFHSGRTIVLALRRPPPVTELLAVTGVSAVERVDPHRFRLEFAEHDPTEALVELSVRRNWGLFQLSPAQSSLEEVFVNLTN
jgi:ABC-2 type transport system ATP-binding protein